MARWKKIVCIGVLALGLAGWFLYQTYEPSHRFEAKAHPLVAAPAAETTAAAETPAEEEPAPAAPEAAAESASTPDSGSSSAFNVLILGLDTTTSDEGRTDVIQLAHVIPDEGRTNIVSVPRDSRVPLPGIGLTKINHAHAVAGGQGGSTAGTEASIQAVSNLLQVPIHYYVKLNFKGFVQFIDEIGGVDVNLPNQVNLSMIRTTLPAGTHHLDGRSALAFVRERYSLANGDFDRQVDQTILLRAVVQKLLSPQYLTELPDLVKKVKSKVVDTNLSDNDLISLAWLFKDMGSEDLKHLQLPGKPLTAQDPLIKKPLWYWVPDMEKVKKLTQTYLR